MEPCAQGRGGRGRGGSGRRGYMGSGGGEIEDSPYGIWLVVAGAIPFAAGFVALVVFLIRRRPSDDLDDDVADQEAV